MVDASDGKIQLHGIGTVGYQEIGKSVLLYSTTKLYYFQKYTVSSKKLTFEQN